MVKWIDLELMGGERERERDREGIDREGENYKRKQIYD